MNSLRVVPASARGFLIATLILLYVPLVFLFVNSFSTGVDQTQGWNLEWYLRLFENQVLGEALKNSLIVTLPTSLISTVLGFLGAMAHFHQRLGLWTQRIFQVSMAVPEIILGISLLMWFAVLGWQLGLTTVIIAHVTLSTAFSFSIVLGGLERMDEKIVEAAQDLGARPFEVLRTILTPILMPSLLGAFLMSFLISFDDFLLTFFVNGVGSDTLPIKLFTSMKIGHTPELSALSVILFLFNFVLGLFLFKIFSNRISET